MTPKERKDFESIRDNVHGEMTAEEQRIYDAGYTNGFMDCSKKLHEQSTEQEPKCNPHPKAIHGFNRNASHLNDRYTCECESWDAYAAGYKEGTMASIEQSTEPVGWLDSNDKHAEFMHKDLKVEHDLRESATPDEFQIPVYTQPQEYLERLCRIMGTFDLATGHAETMGEALDSLESELRDVLGHYREAFKNINTQRCPNCACLEEQNTELDAKLAELEQAEQEYKRGYADAMNWKVQNHLEHLPAKGEKE